MKKRNEPFLVETLIAKFAIERLDLAILRWFARVTAYLGGRATALLLFEDSYDLLLAETALLYDRLLKLADPLF